MKHIVTSFLPRKLLSWQRELGHIRWTLMPHGWGEKIEPEPRPLWREFKDSGEKEQSTLKPTCWWTPHSGIHHLPGDLFFCSVTKLVTLEESTLCIKLSWAKSEDFLLSSQEEMSVPQLPWEISLFLMLIVPDRWVFVFSIKFFPPFLPSPPQKATPFFIVSALEIKLHIVNNL